MCINVCNCSHSLNSFISTFFWISGLISLPLLCRRAGQPAEEHDWEQHVWRRAWCCGLGQRLRRVSGTLMPSCAMHAFIIVAYNFISRSGPILFLNAIMWADEGDINKDQLISGCAALVGSQWCSSAHFHRSVCYFRSVSCEKKQYLFIYQYHCLQRYNSPCFPFSFFDTDNTDILYHKFS